MLSRPRPDPSGVDPAQRMRQMLALPTSGWLPPPPSASPWSEEQESAEPGEGDVPHDEPGPGDEAGEGLGRTGPGPAVPGLDVPGPDVPGPGGAWSEGLAPDDDPAPGGLPSRHGPGGLRALLPVAVATGRLDPGRRGATALVLVALLAAVVAGGVVLRGRPQEVAVPQVLASGVPLPGVSAEAAAADGAAADSVEVVVAVAGEVASPGLVRLPAGSRVDDAVRAAGGPLRPESVGLLNLARLLVDGEQVLVGVDAPPGAAAPATGGAAGPTTAGGLLDLNAAGVADFDDLPGIGPVLAQRILDWRTENGRFASVDQLREVTGIGEAT